MNEHLDSVRFTFRDCKHCCIPYPTTGKPCPNNGDWKVGDRYYCSEHSVTMSERMLLPVYAHHANAITIEREQLITKQQYFYFVRLHTKELWYASYPDMIKWNPDILNQLYMINCTDHINRGWNILKQGLTDGIFVSVQNGGLSVLLQPNAGVFIF